MIEHNLNNLTLDPTKSLSPVDEMVEIFPDAPPRKYLHIIIQCPPAGELSFDIATLSSLMVVRLSVFRTAPPETQLYCLRR
jgi:hypothetical protein